MRLAEDSRGLHRVPSFHRDLALGVSTYALELLSERPDLDVLYVPIGQGSGICGCISARDALGLKTEIVGVQSTEAPAYALSFAADRVVPTNSADTLADGMATRVPDQEALEVILKGVARIASSAMTRSPRRCGPIGPIRTILPRARARRPSRRR